MQRITTRLFSLGEHRKRQSGALLGSVALHAMVVLALVGLQRGNDSSGTTVPSILHAEFVVFDDDANADGGRVPEAQAVAPEPSPAEGAEPVRVTEAPAPATPPPLPALEPAPETFAEAAPEALSVEPEPPVPVVPSEPTAGEPATVTAIEPFLDPRMVARQTAQITQRQRRMLEDKASEWSSSLNELPEGRMAWEHRGQEYSATITRSTAGEDDMGIEHVVVAVTTEQDGNRWSTEMRFKRLAFSSFAQLVDRWDPRVQIHDDVIDGRFHSNSEIAIANSRGIKPAFYGKVTTADGVNTSSSTRPVRHSDVFLGGLETRVRRITLPRRFMPFPAERSIDSDRLQRFGTDSRITFYSDGSYGWQPVGSSGREQRVALSNDPHYLIAAEEADLYVGGVVNGKVLVYTPEDIIVEDDLSYAAHPVEFPESDDYLGLVADRNVAIAEPRTTGPGDLTVHAAIYATRRFVVRRYSARENATLRMLGSISSGSISATEPRFRTEIVFDKRLEDSRPPSFPMTDRYEMGAWDGRWTEQMQPELLRLVNE